MPLQVEILLREEAAPYEAFFSDCASAFFQQSPLWADLISPLSPDKPFFLVAKEAGVPVGGLPLYYFKGALGGILTSVPHAGPLGGCFSDLPRSTLLYEKILETALSLAKKLECVALTLITDPIKGDRAFYGPATYELKNFCQVMDLEKISFDEKDEISVGHSALNNNLRRNIRIAKQEGLTATWATVAEFPEWYAIHEKRQKEVGAKALPKNLLRGMTELLPRAGKGGLALLKKEGQIVGGGLFFWHKETADAYILSSSSEYFSLRPNYLLTEFALKELKQKGIRFLNWQSCQKGSGVYEFKKGWGSRDYLYSFLTWTFLGFEKVLEAPLEEIGASYPWHFVAPFEALKLKKDSGCFEKSSAV